MTNKASEKLGRDPDAPTNVAPQIIRTREELAALDPEAILFRPYDDMHDTIMTAADFLSDYDIDPDAVLPAVVIATGDHVRAARQALEEE